MVTALNDGESRVVENSPIHHNVPPELWEGTNPLTLPSSNLLIHILSLLDPCCVLSPPCRDQRRRDFSERSPAHVNLHTIVGPTIFGCPRRSPCLFCRPSDYRILFCKECRYHPDGGREGGHGTPGYAVNLYFLYQWWFNVCVFDRLCPDPGL